MNHSIAFSLSEVPDIEHFVAREQELKEMHKVLSKDENRETIILHGLGGIGKTQLAIEYAKRYRDNYSAIFWFNINDAESVKQSFIKVAQKILREHPTAAGLGNIDLSRDLNGVVSAVKAWLSLRMNTRWLAIYDNYDNPKLPRHTDSTTMVDIREYLPESYQGSIIVTTRSSRVELGGRSLKMKVTKLRNLKHGLDILSNASRRPDLANSRSIFHLDIFLVLTQLDTDAVELARELDGLPLALATAGAYLHQVTMSVSEYLCLYRKSWSRLQGTSPNLSSYEDRTLHSTWNISYERVKQQNRLSAMLLRLWAYFDKNDLWFELLQHSRPEDPDWIRHLTKDDLNFHEAMRFLADHGFVEANSDLEAPVESLGYSMHGCVHAWTAHVLNREYDQELAKICLERIASHNPNMESTKWWLTQRRLLPHAFRCASMIPSNIENDDTIAWAWLQLGYLFSDHDKFVDAAEMYQRALRGYQNTSGLLHPNALSAVESLSLLDVKQGKFKEAEEKFQQVLQGYEKTLGPEHTTTLSTVINLGNLYVFQDKLTEAEEMFQRALQELGTKSGGTRGMLRLNLFQNLGHVYKAQGKLDEAEKMYHQALHGYEMTLGFESPSTFDTLNSLGDVYLLQGKLEEAEKSNLRALKGKEKMWGPEHTKTLVTINNLGIVFYRQRRWTEAQNMYQRALQGYMTAVGIDHVALYRPANDAAYNMGRLFDAQGNAVEAKRMYERALTGYKAVLGPGHRRYRSVEAKLEALQMPHSVTPSDGAGLDAM